MTILSKILKPRVIIIILIALALVVSVAVYLFDKEIAPPANHTWSKYNSDKLAIGLSYPSDILKPYEANHPKSVDTGFTGADIVQFFDSENHKIIFIWVQEMDVSDIGTWFRQTGRPGSYTIINTTTIAGAEAIRIEPNQLGPAGRANFNLHFINNRKVYSLYIDDTVLLPEEVEYIVKSFYFNNRLQKFLNLFKK